MSSGSARRRAEIRLKLELDHVAVAVHSIKAALKIYRDGLGGEYLMGSEVDDTWRWLQLRFPGGGKIELLEPLGEGFLSQFVDFAFSDKCSGIGPFSSLYDFVNNAGTRRCCQFPQFVEGAGADQYRTFH